MWRGEGEGGSVCVCTKSGMTDVYRGNRSIFTRDVRAIVQDALVENALVEHA